MANLTSHRWMDPRNGVIRQYWAYLTPTGRTYFTFDHMEWHRTFKAAALATA
jgi:hypothetical protein